MLISHWGQARAQGHLDLGSLAPPLVGTDLEGDRLTLSELRGSWVFVDFWATWCAPCMRDLPEVIGLQNRLSSHMDFEVVSVSLDTKSTLKELNKVVADYGVSYPVVYSNEGGASSVISEWNVHQIPSTFLIDPSGVIVARDLKPQEVENRLPMFEGNDYVPIRLQSQNELKRSASISGMVEFRDLHIDLEMVDDAPPISRYQLYVSSSCENHPSLNQHFDVLYDLRVAAIERSGTTRFAVDIRKTSGASYVEGITSNSGAESTIPDMAIRIDEQGKQYSFIVPVPACSSQLTYALALYDEQLNDFVRNGMTTLQVASST